MENYFYAQLDEQNICISVSSLSGEVLQDFMIRIDSMDNDLLGKRYLGNKEWEMVEEPPSHYVETQLDRIEELQLNSAITSEYVASLLELGI